MEVQFIVNNGFTEIVLSGAINMSSLPTLTPQFTSHLNEYTDNHLVLNLSNTTFIDSSIIRLFLNIQKRLSESRKALYLFSPSQTVREILETTNLSKTIPIIDTISEIESECRSQKYLAYTHNENGMNRLRCSCEICGSSNVIGYFMDCSSIEWNWREEDYFPFPTNNDNKHFDFFSLLPIICTECLMCSTDVSKFNILNKTGSTAFRSTVDPKTKQLLSRAIPKRKRIIESSNLQLNFQYPRNRQACYYMYLLAEDCLRTAAVNKTCFNPYMIGYMKFINLRYSKEDQQEKIFDDCHFWLSQALKYKIYSDQIQLAKIYYMEIVSLFKTGDTVEARELFARFSEMIKNLEPSDNTVLLESPFFWFEKAQSIWKKEIQKKTIPIANCISVQ